MLDFLSRQTKDKIKKILNRLGLANKEIAKVSKYWETLKKELPKKIGYDTRDWARAVMYRECFELIKELNPSSLDALEISPGFEWKALGFKSLSETYFPDFDICTQTLDRQFDIIIADQVWEHLASPYQAARNVLRMLKPGGYFLNTTPFLVHVHDVPIDCCRWTELGMKYMLTECGFPMDMIRTGSWGNRAAVIGHFKGCPKAGFRRLPNDPALPIVVWALARRSP